MRDRKTAGNARQTGHEECRNGFAEDKISIIAEEEAAITAALERASEGDLLVIFGDNITRCWKQIIYHGGDREAPQEPESALESQSREYSPGFMLEAGLQLISDERGVRLARDEEGDD